MIMVWRNHDGEKKKKRERRAWFFFKKNIWLCVVKKEFPVYFIKKISRSKKGCKNINSPMRLFGTCLIPGITFLFSSSVVRSKRPFFFFNNKDLRYMHMPKTAQCARYCTSWIATFFFFFYQHFFNGMCTFNHYPKRM